MMLEVMMPAVVVVMLMTGYKRRTPVSMSIVMKMAMVVEIVAKLLLLMTMVIFAG